MVVAAPRSIVGWFGLVWGLELVVMLASLIGGGWRMVSRPVLTTSGTMGMPTAPAVVNLTII